MGGERLRYEEFEPSGELRSNVACFWAIRGRVEAGESAVNRVLPDACMDVIFDFGDGASSAAADDARAFVVGAMRRALIVEHRGRVDVIGVRFRPGGAVPLLGVPALELTDTSAGLGDFWRDATAVAERVSEPQAGATRNRVDRLEALLRQRLARARPVDPLIRAAVHMIRQTRGTVPVVQLETSLGTAPRTLERRFLAGVGITPKAVSRVVRMQTAASLLSRPNPSIAAIAVLAGFHDQAHLTRDFGSLAGTTPAVFAHEHSVGFVQDGNAAVP